MNSYDFTYQKYIGHVGYSNVEVYDFDKYIPRSPWIEVGRIDAIKLHIRPRNEGIAIMLENQETFEQLWFHVIIYETLE